MRPASLPTPASSPMLLRLLGVLLAWPALAGAAAETSNCPPLAESLFRHPDLSATRQVVGGKRILVLDGGIDAGAAARTEAALQRLGPFDEVWLNSPGGNPKQGVAMGKALRAQGVLVRIPAGNWCISACNFAFLGGAIRGIDPGGQYGVHMFTAVTQGSRPAWTEYVKKRGDEGLFSAIQAREQGSALVALEQADFIIRMGVSRKLLSEVMYPQAAAGFRCLSRDEMIRYNVVNAD
jgi:hypothetical protein